MGRAAAVIDVFPRFHTAVEKCGLQRAGHMAHHLQVTVLKGKSNFQRMRYLSFICIQHLAEAAEVPGIPCVGAQLLAGQPGAAVVQRQFGDQAIIKHTAAMRACHRRNGRIVTAGGDAMALS